MHRELPTWELNYPLDLRIGVDRRRNNCCGAVQAITTHPDRLQLQPSGNRTRNQIHNFDAAYTFAGKEFSAADKGASMER